MNTAGRSLQNPLTPVSCFFSKTSRYLASRFEALRPCQGRLPGMKYTNRYPSASSRRGGLRCEQSHQPTCMLGHIAMAPTNTQMAVDVDSIGQADGRA